MSLSKRQRTALEKSIKHWYRLLECKTPGEFNREGYDANDCKLCYLYLGNECQSCPVSIKTKEFNCDGSPYHDAAHHIYCYINGYKSQIRIVRNRIRKEIKFLESLREL